MFSSSHSGPSLLAYRRKSIKLQNGKKDFFWLNKDAETFKTSLLPPALLLTQARLLKEGILSGFEFVSFLRLRPDPLMAEKGFFGSNRFLLLMNWMATVRKAFFVRRQVRRGQQLQIINLGGFSQLKATAWLQHNFEFP